jgi:hypothetical protein
VTVGLLVSHKGDHCGVYQYGRGLYGILSKNADISWSYCECSDFAELQSAVDRIKPNFVLFNHHPLTTPWLLNSPLRSLAVTLFGMVHDIVQKDVASFDPEPFDFGVCFDPTLIPRHPRLLRAPRFLPEPPKQSLRPPETFTVGSFGFATPNKGFARLCSLVNQQLDRAKIRLNLPRHDDPAIVPEEALQAVVRSCKAAITKPGIEIEITHDFFDNDGILSFLAANTLNAFLYDSLQTSGISSCADFALACGRPFALTHSAMFRNFFHINPSVFVEDRSLVEIAHSDTATLDEFRAAAAPDRTAAEWNRAIIGALKSVEQIRATPDGRGFNKMLDDRSLAAYGGALGELRMHAPEMMARKIERANIQQAFGLDTAQRFLAQHANARILAVGSFEDTAVTTLRRMGYRLDEVDPKVNGMTLLDFYLSSKARLGSYDLVLSISVLRESEHDIQFVRMVGEFLRPGGWAVLTVDFAENLVRGTRKPDTDRRPFTSADLSQRFITAMGDCVLVDAPSWREGAEDFEYEGSQHGSVGFVFRRLDDVEGLELRVPVWRELLTGVSKDAGKSIVGIHDPSTFAKEMDFASRAARYDKLIATLEMPDGPNSLKMVLPLARAIRRMRAIGRRSKL